MTREELLALPMRELDVFIATELMEWRWIRQDAGYRGREGILMPKEGAVGSCWGAFLPGYIESHTVTVDRPEDFPSNVPERLPRFSADDNAVRLVRNRIAKLGCIQEFLGQLRQTQFSDGESFNIPCRDLLAWSWLHRFSPQQQCIAAILAVQEKERGE